MKKQLQNYIKKLSGTISELETAKIKYKNLKCPKTVAYISTLINEREEVIEELNKILGDE